MLAAPAAAVAAAVFSVCSWGVLVWEMYCGCRPYAGMSHSQVRHCDEDRFSSDGANSREARGQKGSLRLRGSYTFSSAPWATRVVGSILREVGWQALSDRALQAMVTASCG